MKRATRLLALGIALQAACAHRPVPVPSAPVPPSVARCEDAPFRAHKPEPLPREPEFFSPVPQERKLANGARVLVVENHSLPLVAVEVVLGSGAAREPLDQGGMSRFVADMLLEGTGDRSGIEVAVRLEQLAAEVTAEASFDGIRVHLNTPRTTFRDSVELLTDLLLHPAFRTEDVERVRQRLLTDLAAKRGNARALAQDQLVRLTWGTSSPWGLPANGTPESIKAISGKALARFHETFHVPNNALIVVSGDVAVDEVIDELEKGLVSWKQRRLPVARPVALPPSTSLRGVVLVDLPGANQAQVWIGWRGPAPVDPKMLSLMVANNVLGGLFTSRLNLNLREQKGYTYGVRSSVIPHRDASAIVAGGGILAKHAAQAVTEYLTELRRMSTDAPSDDELERAKVNILRALPTQLETNDGVTRAIAALAETGLPLDYFATLRDRLRAIDKPQVMEAARAFLDAESWPIVVVGPKAKLALDLKALGLGPVGEVVPR